MEKISKINKDNNEIIKKNSNNSRINSIVSKIIYVNKILNFNRIIYLKKIKISIFMLFLNQKEENIQIQQKKKIHQ